MALLSFVTLLAGVAADYLLQTTYSVASCAGQPAMIKATYLGSCIVLNNINFNIQCINKTHYWMFNYGTDDCSGAPTKQTIMNGDTTDGCADGLLASCMNGTYTPSNRTGVYIDSFPSRATYCPSPSGSEVQKEWAAPDRCILLGNDSLVYTCGRDAITATSYLSTNCTGEVGVKEKLEYGCTDDGFYITNMTCN